MGLFDGKKKHVEEEQPRPAAAEPTPQPSAAVEAPPPPKPAAPARYGIDRAIQLMRSLPTDQNPELVSMVIASTLASIGVKVSDIIEDATMKQRTLEGRIGDLKAKIKMLEGEIEVSVDEIVKLEASLAEATSAKERLQLAEKTTAP